MDYEKKYKEALEIARQFSEHPLQEDSSNIVEYIFPELKESEDEKVRKALIEYFRWNVQQLLNDFSNKEAIAWLEKQGGQKFAWSEADSDFMYDTLSNLTEIKDRYGEGYGNVGKCIDWLKSLKQRIGG